MPDQLFTYYIENPLLIISKNSWSCGVMVSRILIIWGELVKVALKCGSRKVVLGWGKRYGAVGFCGPCVCLGVFLLL
jgi:hypothetical protein